MFHIVNRAMLERVGSLTVEQRQIAIYERPTPWRVFLAGFLKMSPEYGLIWLPDGGLESFHAKTKPLFYVWEVLQINGDEYAVVPWNFYDMCKFCLESFQYGFFVHVTKWRWRG